MSVRDRKNPCLSEKARPGGPGDGEANGSVSECVSEFSAALMCDREIHREQQPREDVILVHPLLFK